VEWDELNDIFIALKPFAWATKDLQSNATDGRHGSIWEWLPTIEFLIKHTKEGHRKNMARITHMPWRVSRAGRNLTSGGILPMTLKLSMLQRPCLAPVIERHTLIRGGIRERMVKIR
jgi:hypothetical protein